MSTTVTTRSDRHTELHPERRGRRGRAVHAGAAGLAGRVDHSARHAAAGTPQRPSRPNRGARTRRDRTCYDLSVLFGARDDVAGISVVADVLAESVRWSA